MRALLTRWCLMLMRRRVLVMRRGSTHCAAITIGRSFIALWHIIRNLLARNLKACELFNLLEKIALLNIAKRNRVTALTRARRATNAMHIGFGFHRKIEVHNMRDVIDIESARRNISCNEHRRATRTKRIKRARSCILRLVAVNCIRVNSCGLELARKSISAVLRLGKHNGAIHRKRSKEMHQQLRFLRFEHEVKFLIDALNSARDRRDRNGDRRIEQRISEASDLFRHGRGEEHGLTRGRKQFADLANRFDESHVEHAIGLVEDEEFDLAEIDQSLLQEIDKTTWSRDKNVGALLQRAHLWTLTNAAEDHDMLERQVTTVTRKTLANLRSEFARR